LTEFRVERAGSVSRRNLQVADAAGNPATIDGVPMVWNAHNRLERRGARERRVYDVFGKLVRREHPDTELLTISNDFHYDTARGFGTKHFFIGGERVATRARHFSPDAASASAGRDTVARVVPWMAVLMLGALGLHVAAARRPSLIAAGLALVVAVWPVHRALAVIGVWGAPVRHGGSTKQLLIYGSDPLGSTRVIVDGSGATVETRDYVPYGAILSRTGGYHTRFRFGGHEFEDGTNLYDFGARLYDGHQGRFLSPDPVTLDLDPLSLRGYAYVRNQPTSLVDPDGRVALLGLSIGAVVAGAAAHVGGLVAEATGNPKTARGLRLAGDGLVATAAVLALGPLAGSLTGLSGVAIGTGGILALNIELGVALLRELGRAPSFTIPVRPGPQSPSGSPPQRPSPPAPGLGPSRTLEIEVDEEADEAGRAQSPPSDAVRGVGGHTDGPSGFSGADLPYDLVGF
jgi:RHS repeat-associated protein